MSELQSNGESNSRSPSNLNSSSPSNPNSRSPTTFSPSGVESNSSGDQESRSDDQDNRRDNSHSFNGSEVTDRGFYGSEDQDERTYGSSEEQEQEQRTDGSPEEQEQRSYGSETSEYPVFGRMETMRLENNRQFFDSRNSEQLQAAFRHNCYTSLSKQQSRRTNLYFHQHRHTPKIFIRLKSFNI